MRLLLIVSLFNSPRLMLRSAKRNVLVEDKHNDDLGYDRSGEKRTLKKSLVT